MRLGGVGGNDAFIDRSFNRMGFFCQLLMLLLFFNITGEVNAFLLVFIKNEASPKIFVNAR